MDVFVESVFVREASGIFDRTLTKEVPGISEGTKQKQMKSKNNCFFRLVQVAAFFLIMEITQFQIKVFVTVFFALFEKKWGK
jgi:hypothetical protein